MLWSSCARGGAALALLLAWAGGPLAAQTMPEGDAGSPGAVVAACYAAHACNGPGEGLDTLRLRALCERGVVS